MKHLEEEKITQWFINNVNGTPSEEQLALRKVYEQRQEIERLNSIIKEVREYIETKWKKDSYFEDIDNCLQFCRFNEFEKEDLLEILEKE